MEWWNTIDDTDTTTMTDHTDQQLIGTTEQFRTSIQESVGFERLRRDELDQSFDQSLEKTNGLLSQVLALQENYWARRADQEIQDRVIRANADADIRQTRSDIVDWAKFCGTAIARKHEVSSNGLGAMEKDIRDHGFKWFDHQLIKADTAPTLLLTQGSPSIGADGVGFTGTEGSSSSAPIASPSTNPFSNKGSYPPTYSLGRGNPTSTFRFEGDNSATPSQPFNFSNAAGSDNVPTFNFGNFGTSNSNSAPESSVPRGGGRKRRAGEDGTVKRTRL